MTAVLERSGLAAALRLTALPALAHHSRSIYDEERTFILEGVVTEFE
jgi:hypothetical protein